MATFVNDLSTRLTVVWSHNGAGSVSTRLDLPENVDVIDVFHDTLIAPAGSTAFNIKVGTTVGGAEIHANTDAQAGGRFRPTFSVANLAAMAPAAPTGGAQAARQLYITLTPTGTATAGQVKTTVFASQRALA